ncbi:hypothetical protein Trydic_g20365 [Trypoxylus dichotomus]
MVMYKCQPEATLRKKYLSPMYNKIKTSIVNDINDNQIWISIDETADVKGRKIVNFLVGVLDSDTAMSTHLLASKRVETITAESVSDYVTSCLKSLWGEKHDKNKEKVLLFVTDAAAYMKTAGRLLQQTYSSMMHITCLAHALHLVSEEVRKCYPNADKLISSVMKVFVKAPARKNLFYEKLPHVPLPPEPVTTRWGTWIEAASYYYIHFDDVKTIIQLLDPNDAVSIFEAQQAFTDPTIQTDLANIHGRYSRIPLAIHQLEVTPTSPQYSITNAMNIVYDLRQFLFRLSGDVADNVKQKFDAVLNNNPGFPTVCRIVDLFTDVQRSFSMYKWIYVGVCDMFHKPCNIASEENVLSVTGFSRSVPETDVMYFEC